MLSQVKLNAFVLAVTCLNLFGAAKSQDLAACARTYTVQAGDYCDGISAAQHSSTFQVISANNGTINAACNNLQVDQVICLGLQGKDCSTVTVVQSGDSCAAIANTVNISTTTLLANNPNVDGNCTNIYPGEVLCTSSSIIPYN